MSFNVRNRTVL